jgi:CheY-like chemotaxis protein
LDATDREATRILVISDDPVLGHLIALSLRCRGCQAQATDLPRPGAPTAPPHGPLSLLVLDLERASNDALTALRWARSRPWGAEVPIIVAARDACAAIAKLRDERAMHPAKPDDVRAIVATAVALLPQPSCSGQGALA